MTTPAVVRGATLRSYVPPMRLLIVLLVLAASCRQPTAPASDCPRLPADTATVRYNGERIYLNACPW